MSLTRRQFLQFAGGAGGAAALAALLGPGARMAGALGLGDEVDPGDDQGPPASGPYNFLMILADDQDRQSWADQFTWADRGGKPVLDENGQPLKGWAMPFLRSMPGGGWIDFTGACTTSAICAPSRAGLLTGQAPHDHGVRANGGVYNLDATNTLPVWLEESPSNYESVLHGKYSFGKGGRRVPTPPGWADYNGKGGHAKTVAQKGQAYLIQRAAQLNRRPFFLNLWPVDPHRPVYVNNEFRNIRLIPPPMQPNINEEDVSDKPQWLQRIKPLSESKIRGYDGERSQAYKSVMGIDRCLQDIWQGLVATGEIDRTIIIVTSDHGYFWGNHRLHHKDAAYDEAIRVPLVMRLPWLTENRTEDRVVSLADVTATIADYAGAMPRRPQLGQSLRPIIDDPAAPWEGIAYIESHGNPNRPPWQALRTGGDAMAPYAYVEYPETGEIELYDMTADPAQLQNVAGWAEYADTQATLAGLLQERIAR